MQSIHIPYVLLPYFTPRPPQTSEYTTCTSLTEKSGSNLTHSTFFQLVVLASSSFDADMSESSDNTINVEAHAGETVDQILVVSVISTDNSQQPHRMHGRRPTHFARLSSPAPCRVSSRLNPLPLSDLAGAPAWAIAQSRATRSNSLGDLRSILATSASWGSLGSGVLSKDCSESRADLIVRTGDQALESVSRQIAPYIGYQNPVLLKCISWKSTDRLAADIWMPHFGFKLHGRWSERVVGGDFDIDVVGATFIRGARWPWK